MLGRFTRFFPICQGTVAGFLGGGLERLCVKRKITIDKGKHKRLTSYSYSEAGKNN